MSYGITRMGYHPTYGEGSSTKKPCLSLGSSHPAVMELIDSIALTDHRKTIDGYSQDLIEEAREESFGFDALDITYGPATDKLVRIYQKLALGEEKDKVGPETWITLGYEGEDCGASNGSTSNGSTSNGSTSNGSTSNGSMSITQKKWFYPTVGLGVVLTLGAIIWLMDEKSKRNE